MKQFVNIFEIPLIRIKFYDMHRGEWIKKKIEEIGYSVDTISIKISIGRTTIWRWLKDENLPYLKMKKIADAINLDLRSQFPEASEVYSQQKDYQILYLKELERVRELEEQLLECRKQNSSTGTESGQNE